MFTQERAVLTSSRADIYDQLDTCVRDALRPPTLEGPPTSNFDPEPMCDTVRETL
jgi:hypothetical protein